MDFVSTTGPASNNQIDNDNKSVRPVQLRITNSMNIKIMNDRILDEFFPWNTIKQVATKFSVFL